ncbi:hypothetical protein [Virgibacillus necropolis]|uniref:Uncharacterized protein n=1 Tax=Virgibacillus necropolis TaxID=163877 RepID=A0A221MBI2_9BACI|nr:hypothetical protein [Virgibacillus necropolis]ASN05004.1 hypothetical protein CFK40_08260 [Virgibacillus necropolis]
MSNLLQQNMERFSKSFRSLEEAKSFAKKLHRGNLLQQANRLLNTQEGMDHLYHCANEFDDAGLFLNTPWDNPSKLQPKLVAETLKSKTPDATMEILSELRMLAIAKGNCRSQQVTAKEASHFLNEVMASNVDLLFPDETEASRMEVGDELKRAKLLVQFLANHLSLKTILHSLLEEIERLAVQRPIMVNHIIDLISAAKKSGYSEVSQGDQEKLKKYDDAITGPTLLSRQVSNRLGYEEIIKEKDPEVQKREAEGFGSSMKQTGLVCPIHAELLRHLSQSHPELIATALALNSEGKANLNVNMTLVQKIIEIAIYPATSQSIYGLARFLERGVLSVPSVAPVLRRLMVLPIHFDVSKKLKRKDVTANGVLIAGVISALGQPLGIGQGLNPTCQSARGISLWAQHAPTYLLELVEGAARDRGIVIGLEGLPLYSSLLSGGLAPNLNTELDPVSLILVPHLDRIYSEMMTRMLYRGEDGHKWVNPAFYGHWVLQGFTAVTDSYTRIVSNYEGFVRCFYATHHPDYNGGHELIYPNPVGIFVTNVHAHFLGLHAISIQRIKKDPRGKWRIYFYNPNNDGGQDWGQNIHCSITGNGEEEGESSLPFSQFTARLYAFHYNPLKLGQTQAVPRETLAKVEKLAQESWGRNYTWA